MDHSTLGNLFELDNRTVVGVLFWGNLLMSLLIFAFYKTYKHSDNRKEFFYLGFSKLVQGCALYFFRERGQLDDIFTINLANILLFTSFYFESIVLLSIINRDSAFNRKIQLTIYILSLVVFNLIDWMLNDVYRISAGSTFSFLFYLLPTWHYLNRWGKNNFQVFIGLSYLVFIFILLWRATMPFLIPNFSLFSDNQVQNASLLVVLIIILVNSTGLFLLIVLKNNDAIHQARAEVLQINQALQTEILEKKQLADNLSFNKFAFDKMADAAYWISSDGLIGYFNEAAMKMLGRSEEDIENKNIKDLGPVEMATNWSIFWEKLKENSVLYFESTQASADGRIIPVEVHANLLAYEGKEYAFATVHDITRRVLVEKDLKESERRFRDMMEQVHLCSAMLDKNAGITFANDYFLSMTGWKREEVIGKNWFEMFTRPSAAVRTDLFKGIEEGVVPTYYVNEILTRTGASRLVRWSNTILHDEQGNNSGIAGIGVDITDQDKAEKALLNSESKLKELNATKDKFFSIMAHDLANPFNSILGFSELLIKEVQAENKFVAEEYAQIIHMSTQHVMNLLSNLMTWSRAQTGKMEFNPEYFDLGQLILDCQGLSEGSARQKSITLNHDIPDRTIVFADKAMISTVLRNLLSNAIKFTNPNGRIQIHMAREDHQLTVSIEDNGIGMKPEVLTNLFRIDVSYSTLGTNDEKGTGLGLLICKEFIERHRGRIWFESSFGQGTAVHFSIPTPIL